MRTIPLCTYMIFLYIACLLKQKKTFGILAIQKLFKASTPRQDRHLAFPSTTVSARLKDSQIYLPVQKHARLNLLLRLSTNWLGAQSGDLSNVSDYSIFGFPIRFPGKSENSCFSLKIYEYFYLFLYRKMKNY